MTKKTRSSYGYGAQGEIDVPVAAKVAFGSRLRYYFDNSMSKAGSFVLYAFILLAILSVITTAFHMWIYGTPLANEADPNDFGNNVIARMFGILGDVPAATWADRLTSLLGWVAETGVNAIVIGFAATAISGVVENLKAGKSAVINTDHTLILGWSNRIFPILSELAVANANIRRASVVIFANVDRIAMEDEIRARAGNLGKLKIVTRNGDPTNPSDLTRANLTRADLREANLRFADLSNADLSNADLRHADLRQAVLDGARLCGADLQEALMPDGRRADGVTPAC
jgi:hypothetical protein